MTMRPVLLALAAFTAALTLSTGPADAVSPTAPCSTGAELGSLRFNMPRGTVEDILDGPGRPFALIDTPKGWEIRHYAVCGRSYARAHILVMYYTGTASDVDRLDYAGVLDFTG